MYTVVMELLGGEIRMGDGCEIHSGGKTQMNAGSIRWYTFLQSRSTFINFNCPPRA